MRASVSSAFRAESSVRSMPARPASKSATNSAATLLAALAIAALLATPTLRAASAADSADLAAAADAPLDDAAATASETLPVDLPTEGGLVEALTIVTPQSAKDLNATFEGAAFDLDAVRVGTLTVPRLYVTKLPGDLRGLKRTDQRKLAFIGALLPLVLMANEEILEQRAELERLLAKEAAGEALGLEEQGWLAALAELYRADPGDSEELLRRVDALPVALTLAQAIEESGWGTSRYARDGNALFGQRTWHQNSPGLTARKDGQPLDHRARAFADLMQSVRAYMHNLNTHTAYRKLRDERARMRDAGEAPDGAHLAGFLGSYAENDTYVDNLRRLMRHNELAAYESAALAIGVDAEAVPSPEAPPAVEQTATQSEATVAPAPLAPGDDAACEAPGAQPPLSGHDDMQR